MNQSDSKREQANRSQVPVRKGRVTTIKMLESNPLWKAGEVATVTFEVGERMMERGEAKAL